MVVNTPETVRVVPQCLSGKRPEKSATAGQITYQQNSREGNTSKFPKITTCVPLKIAPTILIILFLPLLVTDPGPQFPVTQGGGYLSLIRRAVISHTFLDQFGCSSVCVLSRQRALGCCGRCSCTHNPLTLTCVLSCQRALGRCSCTHDPVMLTKLKSVIQTPINRTHSQSNIMYQETSRNASS